MSRSMIVDVSSPPNLMLLPQYAENVAKVMAATSTRILREPKRRVRNPFVDDEAKEGEEDDSDYSKS